MINEEIAKITDQLQNVVQQQMEQAKQSLVNLPDNDTKQSLKDLLRRASDGKVTHHDVHREIQKIIKNASSD